MAIDEQTATAASATPDGIDPHYRSRIGRLATPVTFALLGGFLALGLAGLFGGQASPVVSRDMSAARLAVMAPQTLRNGEFFEMVVTVDSKAPIADATIAFEPTLWRSVTINTTMPSASEESFEGGHYRMSYGPLAEGERLVVKLDGQVNPPLFGGTKGSVALFDGDRPIGSIPWRIRVMP